MEQYYEREIKEPVLLCDLAGKLNPEAIGWSRYPLHIYNLSGSWLRKKKWNYWCITSKQNCLSAEGVVEIDGKKYLFDKENSFACLDYGRGILRSLGHQIFGYFSGKIEIENKIINIERIVGLCEEHIARW